MKKLVFFAALFAFVVLFVFSPYLAIFQLNDSIKNNNLTKMAKIIDLPVVKTNVAERFKTELIQKNPELSGKPNDIVTTAKILVLSKSVDYVVNMLITPENIRTVFNELPKQQNSDNKIKVSYAYVGMNQFNIDYNLNNNNHTIVLERESLFFWRVKDIVFKLDPTLL